MERVKEALIKARQKRDEGLEGQQRSSDKDTASGSRLGKDRILEREPFKGYSPELQEKLLQNGRVLNIGVGETLQFVGDRDGYVHYLLSGAVVLESEQEAKKTIAADQDLARQPLDAVGVKLHTIMASSDAELLRVPQDVLAGVDESTPLSTEAYAETLSGKQLAALVEQINLENEAVQSQSSSVRAIEPHDLLGDDAATTSLSELSASADSLFSDIDIEPDATDNAATDEAIYRPKTDDDVGRFMRDLELRFRRYVEKVKVDERLRYEEQLQKHSERLRGLADKEVQNKLKDLNTRFEEAYADKEDRLREQYNNLRDLANKMAHQKAAIYAARKQIAEKLESVERIHSELSQLGNQINYQLEDLDSATSVEEALALTGTDER